MGLYGPGSRIKTPDHWTLLFYLTGQENRLAILYKISVNLGVSHNPSMLLTGPPGCGKNSLVNALASDLKFDIYNLSLGDLSVEDNELGALLGNMDPSCILLLDELDKAAVRWEQAPQNSQFGASQGVSEGAVLEFLDGTPSPDDTLIISIANDVSRLPAALVRDGRIHMTVELGQKSKSTVHSMFDSVMKATYREGSSLYTLAKLADLASRFADMVDEEKHSPATLSQFIRKIHRS
ncbi:MAG: hypothetical protein Q9210_001796 [Variospora velana]